MGWATIKIKNETKKYLEQRKALLREKARLKASYDDIIKNYINRTKTDEEWGKLYEFITGHSYDKYRLNGLSKKQKRELRRRMFK